MLSGSEFSKGLLLLVVVWCQNTVNGSLISFKRLKGLIERLAGGFIYDQVTYDQGKQVGHKFKFRPRKVKKKKSSVYGELIPNCAIQYVD